MKKNNIIRVTVKEILNMGINMNTSNPISELYMDDNIIVHCEDNNTDYPKNRMNDLVEYVNIQRNNYSFRCDNKNHQETLLFLGNGFDLALGYSTSYRNFYDSAYFKKLLNKNNTLCESIKFSPSKDLWSDLERGLYYYSLQQTLQYGMGNSYMSNKFKKDFKELKRALLSYIQKEQSLEKEKDGLVKDLIYRWAPVVQRAVTFNFSYLSIANLANTLKANVFNNDNSYNNDVMIHQHGAIYNPVKAKNNYINNIVLGIDETMKVEDMHGFLYKSKQRRGNINSLRKWMDDATTYIVFGCSMGDSDACYFMELFKNTMKEKKYLIYGKDEVAVKELMTKVDVYSGGLDIFSKHNVVKFLNCENDDETLKLTEKLLEVHN